MTGYSTPAERRRALEAGFDDHLPKPVSDTVLQTLLRTQQRLGSARPDTHRGRRVPSVQSKWSCEPRRAQSIAIKRSDPDPP